ncbi:hypothetical protein GGR58DRAFT_500209 [Xylaria digitata]|nr:hypothetical protein GGR58DRAFT_500209 [Xylaria digitata]
MFVRVAKKTQSYNYSLTLETEYTKVLSLFTRQVLDIENLRREWGVNKGTDLLSLLQRFSDRKATDGRGKVYTLFGLARQEGLLIPNYSISIDDLYQRTVIVLIESCGNLAPLSGDLKRKNSQSLASWIPDRSAIFDKSDRERMVLHRAYSACSNWRIAVFETPDEYWNYVAQQMDLLARDLQDPGRRPRKITAMLRSALRKYGRYLGRYWVPEEGSLLFYLQNYIDREEVSWMRQVFPEVALPWEMLPQYCLLPKWRSFCFGGKIPTLEKPTSFLRTLVGDINWTAIGPDRISPADYESLAKWFHFTLLPRLDGIGRERVFAECRTLTYGSTSSEKSFDEEMRLVPEGRVLFLTDYGLMGLGPASMAPKDEIHVLPGGRTHFVLRPRPPSVYPRFKEFELIGYCFLESRRDHSERSYREEEEPLKGMMPDRLPQMLFYRNKYADDEIKIELIQYALDACENTVTTHTTQSYAGIADYDGTPESDGFNRDLI